MDAYINILNMYKRGSRDRDRAGGVHSISGSWETRAVVGAAAAPVAA